MDFFIGPHVSISGGVFNAPLNAHSFGATGFGMFVKNQRQWQAKIPTASEAERFAEAMESFGYNASCVLPHAGYLINLANPDVDKRNRSLDSLVCELEICASLGLDRLNLHPGSSLKLISTEAACELVSDSINRALAATSGVSIVLENTAGSGGNLGSTFSELAAIIDGVGDKTRIGVCIDTMHSFGAGIAVHEKSGWQAAVDEFDRLIGLKYLRGMHLNDSMVDFASRKDRHQSIGFGKIGAELFLAIAKDVRFRGIPLVLETPDESKWGAEVEMLLNASKEAER